MDNRFNDPITITVDFYQQRDGWDEYREGTQKLTLTQYEDDYVAIETERWAASPSDLRKLAEFIEDWLKESADKRQKYWGNNE